MQPHAWRAAGAAPACAASPSALLPQLTARCLDWAVTSLYAGRRRWARLLLAVRPGVPQLVCRSTDSPVYAALWSGSGGGHSWACSCGGGGGSCGGWCLVRTRAQMLRPRKPGSGDKGGKEVSGASKPSRGRPSRARPARAVERKLRQARADRPAVQGASFPHGSAPHRCKWVTIQSLSALAAGAAAMELFRVAAGPACCSRMPLPTARAAQVRGATHHQTLHLPGR